MVGCVTLMILLYNKLQVNGELFCMGSGFWLGRGIRNMDETD